MSPRKRNAPPADVPDRVVQFPTQFGITLTANCYEPKDALPEETRPAVIVFGPFGTVKEQQAGICARRLAALGLRTLAPDPSFLGDSGGQPRWTASPDINVEDIRAAVDHLSLRPDVDRDRIIVLGLGGWGGLALNAAAIDTRIAAVVTVAMRDIGRLMTDGRFDNATDPDERYRRIQELNLIRTQDLQKAKPTRTKNDPTQSPLVPTAKERDYYQIPPGFHKNAPNSLRGWPMTAGMAFLFHTLAPVLPQVRCPVLMIQGGQSAQRYFSEEAFALLHSRKISELRTLTDCTDPQLLCAPDSIPFSEIAAFLDRSLKHSSVQKRRSYTAVQCLPPRGSLVLNLAGPPADCTAQRLALMFRAEKAPLQKVQDPLTEAKRYQQLILLLPVTRKGIDPDTARLLRDAGYKSKDVITVGLTQTTVYSPQKETIAARLRAQIGALLPYCNAAGSMCVAANAAPDRLIREAAAMIDAGGSLGYLFPNARG